FQPQQEFAQVRLGRSPGGDTNLGVIDSRHDPGDVARRNTAVRKAMQEARVQRFERLALDFQAGEKVPVAVETKLRSDVRARAICANEKAGMQAKRRDHDATCMLDTAIEFAAIQ